MAKSPETVSDLSALLAGMSPRLVGGAYFIASVDESRMMAIAGCLEYILAIFREEEGLSVVLSGDIKAEISGLTEKGLAGPFALITIGVDSDLMAVGFLAKMASALAEKGISVNAYSAYHHDHLLVPYEKKDAAMAALGALSKPGG